MRATEFAKLSFILHVRKIVLCCCAMFRIRLACIALACRTIVVQGSRPDRMVAMAMATLDANMCVSFRNHLLEYLILLQCL